MRLGLAIAAGLVTVLVAWSAPEFHDAVLDALRSSRRKFVELVRTAHAPDHPATFPEAQYLKCVFARLEP